VSTTVRFRGDAAEQIIIGVMQQNRMPVNLIQPALHEVIKILYDNGIFLAGDLRYPAVQQLVPRQPQQPQQPPQPPQARPAPMAAPPPYYPAPQVPAPVPVAAPPQFMVPGMQPGVGFPPPPQGMPPPPPGGPALPGSMPVAPGHPNSQNPIVPAAWVTPAPAPVSSNPGLISHGPHAVPVHAPMMPEVGPVSPGGMGFPSAHPAPVPRGAPNVVPGPFAPPTL